MRNWRGRVDPWLASTRFWSAQSWLATSPNNSCGCDTASRGSKAKPFREHFNSCALLQHVCTQKSLSNTGGQTSISLSWSVALAV